MCRNSSAVNIPIFSFNIIILANISNIVTNLVSGSNPNGSPFLADSGDQVVDVLPVNNDELTSFIFAILHGFGPGPPQWMQLQKAGSVFLRLNVSSYSVKIMLSKYELW